MEPRRYHVIFNSKSGTAATTGISREDLERHFREAELEFTIDSDEDASISERVQRGLSGPADTIVAAGGDGTVMSVAEALLGSGKKLAVLPLGSLNALARELHLPLDPVAAIKALPTLAERSIDVAEVNGRPFLHNVLIGVIPGIAVGREFMRGKRGLSAVIGFTSFMYRRLQRARRMALAIETDLNGSRIERLATLMIANNSYQQRVGAIMSRRRIDRGTLTAYLVRSLSPMDALRLATGMFIGRWRDDEVIEHEASQTVLIQSKRKRILVTMDGEVLWLHTPLIFAIRPLGLSVLAPPEDELMEKPELALEQGP